MSLKIPTADIVPGCNYCGSVHEHMNATGAIEPIICNHCHVCWALCEHTAFCRWQNVPKDESKPAIEVTTSAPGVTKVGTVTSLNLKDAFEAWFTSSELIKSDADPTEAWKELEAFVNEILTPVDKAKRYLLLEETETGDAKVKFLKSDNLNVNQLGEYIQLEGRKRVRLGRNVAVM